MQPDRVELTVEDPDGLLPAAATALSGGSVSFRGASRFARVVVDGSIRLAADRDLLLGTEAARNDRSAIELRRGARALLRDEAPVVTFTADPAPSTEVVRGSNVTVEWQVTDPLGLVETQQVSTFAPTPAVQTLWDEPTSRQSASPTTLAIPMTDAPDSVSYTVQATDEAGRVTTATASWPVLGNEPPAGIVSLAAGTTTPVPAGYPFTAVVHATDREGLAQVTLVASGPVGQSSQAVAASGTSTDVAFPVNVVATADGSEPVVLQAVVTDAAGAATTTVALSVPVAANGSPTGSVALASGAPARIQPGQSTTVVVHAEDPDGLSQIALHATGPVTASEQTQTVSGTSADATFTVTAASDAVPPQTVTLTATLADSLGTTAETGPATFSIVADATQPDLGITFDPELENGARYRPGDLVTVTAGMADGSVATDLRLVGAGTQVTSAGEPVTIDWTVPEVTSTQSFTFEAFASDGAGKTWYASRTVSAEPAPEDAPPVVEFACPTNGVVLPRDYTVPLQVAAADDFGIALVRFYFGDEATPFAQIVPDGAPTPQAVASASYDLSTSAGATARFRVEAVDTAGQTSEQTIEIELRDGVVELAADGQGTNDWASLTDQVVALRGTLTLDQPVTVGGYSSWRVGSWRVSERSI